jgi:hypothetical protein
MGGGACWSEAGTTHLSVNRQVRLRRMFDAGATLNCLRGLLLNCMATAEAGTPNKENERKSSRSPSLRIRII